MRFIHKIWVSIFIIGFSFLAKAEAQPSFKSDFIHSAEKILRTGTLKRANRAMREAPVTVTAVFCPRSAGTAHDFYSEGDYWWPDPEQPDSPFIRRDGLSNPDNFTAHRKAMIRFSEIVGSLASAYLLTGNEKYAKQALKHCRAWLIDTATLMNPNLLYAQAIKGRVTGRGIGIIDAIQLMEVAKALEQIERHFGGRDQATFEGCRQWFRKLVRWLTTHPYGQEEMKARNNHGTCWVMQVAVFAGFIGDSSLIEFCRERFKKVILPEQMKADGSFPLELARTKPYGYSLFNLDAMATICQELSAPGNNLWTFATREGKSMEKGIRFMLPYVADKSGWPYVHDVMYWNDWPVAQPFLIFGAIQFNQPYWFSIWKRLDHKPEEEEIIRNLPVRNPLLWIE